MTLRNPICHAEAESTVKRSWIWETKVIAITAERIFASAVEPTMALIQSFGCDCFSRHSQMTASTVKPQPNPIIAPRLIVNINAANDASDSDASSNLPCQRVLSKTAD